MALNTKTDKIEILHASCILMEVERQTLEIPHSAITTRLPIFSQFCFEFPLCGIILSFYLILPLLAAPANRSISHCFPSSAANRTPILTRIAWSLRDSPVQSRTKNKGYWEKKKRCAVDTMSSQTMESRR